VRSKTITAGGQPLSPRLDHQFSPSRILSATFFYNSTFHDEPHWSTEGAVYRILLPDSAYSVSVNYTHGFSPAAVNSFTFGRAFSLAGTSVAGGPIAPDLTAHGFNIRRESSTHTAFPQVNLFSTNLFTPGGYEEGFTGNSVWSWRDDFSVHTGRQGLKMGVEARWLPGPSQLCAIDSIRRFSH
jgi:hypothetical protein